MLIAYDNLFRLPPQEMGEKTELSAHSHSRIMVCMRTDDFRIDYEGGKASISLSRHLTNQEARDLANAMLKRVDELEQQDRDYELFSQSSQKIPLPPGIQFTTVANSKVGHGG